MLTGASGGCLLDSGALEWSENGGTGSLLAGKDAGLCNDLGEGCLS